MDKNIIRVKPIINGEASGRELFYTAPRSIKVGQRVEISTKTFKNYGSIRFGDTVHAIVVAIENDHSMLKHEHLCDIVRIVDNLICEECRTIPCVCSICEACG